MDGAPMLTNDEWLRKVAEMFKDLERKLTEANLKVVDGCLMELDLSKQQLSTLPNTIGQLTTLSSLDLHYNRLASFPVSIAQLTRLTKLDLHDNQLRSISESIGQLVSLTSLDLWDNQLASLPVSIGQLTKLASLNLGKNKFASVPESLGLHTRLEWLNLGKNQLTSLPRSIGQLTSLMVLRVEKNKLATLPESIGQLASLTELHLSNNELTTLPESIGKLTSLTTLYLLDNQLVSLPESIEKLTTLTNLHLSCNQFTTLPESIVKLTLLTTLDLDNNQLAFLPESMGQLNSLTELRLSKNKLATLPECFEFLTSMKKLDLGSNQLTGEIPMCLLKLVNLHTLDLSYNADLCGVQSSLACKVVNVAGTSSVRIKTKPVRNLSDRLFIVTHVLLGYADLVTDVLSIVQFSELSYVPHYKGLMMVNILLLLFNVCIDVGLMPDARGKVLALLQVQQAAQAYESLSKGRQTATFVRSKKVDAVCRSMPSVVLQLYGLLCSLYYSRDSALSNREFVIISLSVAFGVTGSAITLGSSAAKSGKSLFSYAFGVHFCYYVCELTVRLLSMGLLFVVYEAFALCLLCIEFLVRLGILLCQKDGRGKNCLSMVKSKALAAILLFGSDAIDGPTEISLKIWSSVSSCVLVLALLLANKIFSSDSELYQISLNSVAALACVALFFKYAIGYYIWKTTLAQTGPLSEQDEKKDMEHEEENAEESRDRSQIALPPLPRRASQNVSLDATYDGSLVDRIPSARLHAQHPGPGSASLAAGRGSTRYMTDNPLRPSAGGGAAPGSLQHGSTDRV